MEKNNYSDNNENYKNDNNYKIIIKKGKKKDRNEWKREWNLIMAIKVKKS